MRQVAIGAVVAFVLTVIALSVWRPTTGAPTPASNQPPPAQPAPPPPQNRLMVAPPAVLPPRARVGQENQPQPMKPMLREQMVMLPGARLQIVDAGTP